MLYELMGRLHAAAHHATTRAAGQRGQGTVEYVGLVLLLAVVLAGVVMAADKVGGKDAIPAAIIKKLKGAIDSIGMPSGKS